MYSEPAMRQSACARNALPSAACSSTSVCAPERYLSTVRGFSATPPLSTIGEPEAEESAAEAEAEAEAEARARLREGGMLAGGAREDG